MKVFLTLTLCAIISQSVAAQNIIRSKKYNISFESTEVLNPYDTEASNVLGYESANYAVDIEVFTFDEEPEYLLKDPKFSAKETAKLLGLEKIEDGGTIPNIKNAHYVISYEIYDDETNPVFVLFIIDQKQKLVFEVTTYCYDQNLEEGRRITKSFKLIN